MSKIGAIHPSFGQNTIIKEYTDTKIVKKKPVITQRYTIEIIGNDEQCETYLTNLLKGGQWKTN